MSNITICPPWRHFVATAPDMVVSGPKNTPIDIYLRKYMLQGAHPVDPAVLSRRGFQGGYLLTPLVKVPPRHGKVSYAIHRRGFSYQPFYDFIGHDEFFYVFNNGTQNSNVGKIEINVTDGPSGHLIVTRLRPTKDPAQVVLNFTATYNLPAGWPAYDFVTMTLVETVPVVVLHNKVPYVYDTPYVFAETRTDHDAKTGTPRALQSVLVSDWKSYTIPYMVDGYLPNTSQPYPKPIWSPFPMELRIDFYRGAILKYMAYWDGNLGAVRWGPRFTGWQTHDAIVVNITDSLGPNWHKNGLVQWIDYGSALWPPQFNQL